MRECSRRFILLALVILITACGASNNVTSPPRPGVSPELRAVMDDPRYASARWGLHVVDQATGEVIYSQSPTERFLTGSTAKILSVTSALATFGADYRFETPVVHTGNLVDGTLTGDLILVGSGDLTLGGRTKPDGTVDVPIFDHYDANVLPGLATLTPQDPLAGLNALAAQIRAEGVTSVAGDVIVDERLWDPVVLGDVPISPISVNDNLVDFLITPGAGAGAAVTFDWRPKTAAYVPDMRVTTGPPDSEIALELAASPDGKLVVTGSVPQGAAPVVYTYQVPEPGAFARTLFIEALVRAGVTVAAEAVGPNPAAKLATREVVASAPRLALFISPPFSEHARLINKVSHNLGANQLPLLLAAKEGKRTLEEGLAIERAFVEAAGVLASEFTISDGQGLAGCSISPSAMTTYLRYLSKRQDFSVFFDSTPILGVDGSLANVLPDDDPARGRGHAKTGTLLSQNEDGALILQTKALAGYIHSAKGRKLAFAIFLNDMSIASIDDILSANSAIGRMASLIYQAQ